MAGDRVFLPPPGFAAEKDHRSDLMSFLEDALYSHYDILDVILNTGGFGPSELDWIGPNPPDQTTVEGKISNIVTTTSIADDNNMSS